ncbi:hypothetical protein GON03_09485 [Nocardioides sp. MAH-18]|uniref:O-antigen ligase domain-containing protein n=1 Tax=Nocardioides agri TaxID=2682843 RepID=A0A6L6XRN6_9ACTN|nr:MULTISPECIES: hypothetical protein [unclassified Nocardioides]MBA2954554.1 hypothetical protein [Nocardioides sp. CGMCC 1.13656]MVQ49413.1 hypothetical protein [Nocardioides sp. MAH-18]
MARTYETRQLGGPALTSALLGAAIVLAVAYTTRSAVYAITVGALSLLLTRVDATLRTPFAIWLGATICIPIWFGVTVGGVQVPFATLLAVAALFFIATSGMSFQLNIYDWLVVALWAGTFIAWQFGGSPAFFSDATLRWSVPYFLVRLTVKQVGLEPVYRAFLAAGLVVAVWSVAEWATDVHMFADTGYTGIAQLKEIWQTIQLRNGHARSEAAFGHSIALGCFLAMLAPLAMRSRHPVVYWLVIAAGAAASLSRTAVLAVALSTLLALWSDYGRRKRASGRVLIIGVLAAAAYYVATSYTTVSSSTEVELSDSSTYRSFVLEQGLPLTQWIGTAPGIKGLFQSVDNAYLRLALQDGRLVALALLALMLCPLILAIFRRPGPATAGVAAMSVALTAVALITQWEMLVFALLATAASELEQLRATSVAAMDAHVIPSGKSES